VRSSTAMPLVPIAVFPLPDCLTETNTHLPSGVVTTANGDPGISICCSPLCSSAAAELVRIRAATSPAAIAATRMMGGISRSSSWGDDMRPKRIPSRSSETRGSYRTSGEAGLPDSHESVARCRRHGQLIRVGDNCAIGLHDFGDAFATWYYILPEPTPVASRGPPKQMRRHLPAFATLYYNFVRGDAVCLR